MLKVFCHLLIFIFLTVITQVGGIVWIATMAFIHFKKLKCSRVQKIIIYLIAYLIITLLLIPLLAPLGGRTALPLFKSGDLVAHTYLTPLLNRHYVTKELHKELEECARIMEKKHKDVKLSYLDANFPFFDGFPLLPHLSHNDGRKVDLAFYYKKNGIATDKKPSRTGYGAFVSPKAGEPNQTKVCKQQSHWQYDITRYLTLGSQQGYVLDNKRTADLIKILANRRKTQKIFLEPHLKSRLGLSSNGKVRFQGCHSVRHDDHIHMQIF